MYFRVPKQHLTFSWWKVDAEIKKGVAYKKSVDTFVFKTPQNLEQLWFVDSIHDENNKNNKGVLGIIVS